MKSHDELTQIMGAAASGMRVVVRARADADAPDDDARFISLIEAATAARVSLSRVARLAEVDYLRLLRSPWKLNDAERARVLEALDELEQRVAP
ncbi:MAG TPA: hypothetical protein VE591_00130 [Candidatus Acidoferrum sp.]|jgi:precorrin-6x reductase|nr:hypothetical protein [Candidatus Acidoferrum sp.]